MIELVSNQHISNPQIPLWASLDVDEVKLLIQTLPSQSSVSYNFFKIVELSSHTMEALRQQTASAPIKMC